MVRRLGVYDIWKLGSEQEYPRSQFHQHLGRVVENFLIRDGLVNPGKGPIDERLRRSRILVHDAAAGSGHDAAFLRERLPGIEVSASDGSPEAQFKDFERRGDIPFPGEQIDHVPWSHLSGYFRFEKRGNYPNIALVIGPSFSYANAWRQGIAHRFNAERREMELGAALVNLRESMPYGGRIIADAHFLQSVRELAEKPSTVKYSVDIPDEHGGGKATVTERMKNFPDPSNPQRGMHEWNVTVRRGKSVQVQTLRSLILDHERLGHLLKVAGFTNVQDISHEFPGYPYAVLTAEVPRRDKIIRRKLVASERRRRPETAGRA